MNLALSISSILLLYVFFMGVIVTVIINGNFSFQSESKPVGTYEYNGREREIYDDPLPLVIEDLSDIAGNWSKEMDHQETGLVSYTEYDQRALWTEPREVPNLSYTVTDIKVTFLRDFIQQAVLNSRQDEVHDDFVLTDHYEPVDASIWGADEAYAVSRSENYMTDGSGLSSFLEVIFRANSNRQDRPILGRIAKGNHTFVAVNIFADYIAVPIFQSACQRFFLGDFIAVLIIIGTCFNIFGWNRNLYRRCTTIEIVSR